MDSRENRLRSLMTQHYDPTREGPTERYLADFRGKRFSDGTVAERFHENTKITAYNKHKPERSAATFVEDEALQFAVERIRPDHAGRERISLPDPDEEPSRADLFGTLGRRRSVRDYDTAEPMSVGTLSNLLYHTASVSETNGEKALRRYPSAGAHYPVETYFHLSAEIGHLDPGTYYYVSEDHELQSVVDCDADRVCDLFADADSFDYLQPELSVFPTAAFWRSYAKYGPRAYRYVLQEVGHLAQNLQLVATALGLGAIPRAGYLDRRVNDHLGLDGVNEAVVSAVTVGSTNEVTRRR